MGEPTSAATAIGAGLLAAALASLGLSAQPLFWALIGATLGMSVAPNTGRTRAAIVFTCAVLSSALLGIYVAQVYLPNVMLAPNVVALLLGTMFHPLLASASKAVPKIFDALLKRFGIGGEAS